MKVKLNARPEFTGELYGIRFNDGLSLDHVGEYIFTRLKIVEGCEPVWIEDTCDKCKELMKQIEELTVENSTLKSKRNKS